MCGVAAVFSYHPSAPPIDRAELRSIRDHMAKRGPDAQGEWYSADGRLGIGHRRLSIIDLSDNGTQPMLNSRGSLVLSFNGEIYNYRSLRKSLEREGRVFRTKTDTEVILHLYESKGESMLDDLRGMFAFVLWDATEGRLLLARDPYGIKPLYYANDGWTLRVASQVKALLAGGHVSHSLDPAGQVGFFLFGSVPEPYTTYQEIQAVPAGSIIRVDTLGPSVPRVWKPLASVLANGRNEAKPVDMGEAGELVKEVVRDSIDHHLVSDVPLGAFLSSGTDSTTLVRIARECGSHDLETITLSFAEFSGHRDDESLGAETIAREHRIRHTTARVEETEFRDDLPMILDAMDQPTIDGINTWIVSKKASELGLKVCLSGLGGDELFCGYPSFRQIPRWVGAMGIPSRIPYLGKLVRTTYRSMHAESFGAHPKAAEFVSYAGYWYGAYLLKRGLFLPWELHDVLGKEVASEGLRRLRIRDLIEETLHPDPGSDLSKVACMEASLYLRNQLLRDADWAGMAHSVEIRVPLADIKVLDRIAPIFQTSFAKYGKSLLACSSARVTRSKINGARKTGFRLPMDQWISNLRGELDSWRRVPTLSRSGCHWSRRLAYALHSRVAA